MLNKGYGRLGRATRAAPKLNGAGNENYPDRSVTCDRSSHEILSEITGFPNSKKGALRKESAKFGSLSKVSEMNIGQ